MTYNSFFFFELGHVDACRGVDFSPIPTRLEARAPQAQARARQARLRGARALEHATHHAAHGPRVGAAYILFDHLPPLLGVLRL